MGFYRALGRQREVESTVNVKITVSVWEGGGGVVGGGQKWPKQWKTWFSAIEQVTLGSSSSEPIILPQLL